MNRPKWFVRTGVLILLLGFFMPTMLVSCSGITGVEQSFSLADLATQMEQPILYLFAIGALAAGVFSFLPVNSASEARNFLIAQIAAVGIGLLGLIISFASLSSQIQQGSYGMFEVKPDFGAFVILAGLVVFGVGWFEQWTGSSLPINIPFQRQIEAAPPIHDYVDETPPRRMLEQTLQEQTILPARLEPVKGSLPRQVINIDYDGYTIGRASDNSLVIHDTAVSRHHAQLRFAEGAWFIQDTNSKGGLVVNGETVPAARLEPGDRIEIAGNTFVFRC